MLKRLPLFFAAVTLGLLFAGWVTLRLGANRVVAQDADPVRRQLLADWSAHADALERDLGRTQAWSTLGAATPPELGCQLRWAGDGAALERHAARCPEAPPAIDEATLAWLEQAGDGLLSAPARELPKRDWGFLAQLEGRDDWRQAEGTPLEFFTSHPTLVPWSEAPHVEVAQVRALALLRLVEGARTADGLEPAVKDVVALARALLGRPLVLDQLAGVAVLQRLRAVLDAAGHPALGPPAAEVAALPLARQAPAFLWHPWVPSLYRERFLPRLHAASRCAALAEAQVVLELGPLLFAQYPDFSRELSTWLEGAPCPTGLLARATVQRQNLPERSWRPLIPAKELVQRAELGDALPSFFLWVAENTGPGRRALTELMLSVTTSRPFPSAT